MSSKHSTSPAFAHLYSVSILDIERQIKSGHLKATKIGGEGLLRSLFDELAAAAIKIDPMSDESNNSAE
jgi:hypothetical protein